MLKVCVRCLCEKDITLFSPADTCKDGHRNYCKACQKKAKDAWRARNKEHHNAKGKAWVLANPEKRKESRRNSTARNKHKYENLSRKWKKENKDRVNLSTAMRRRKIRQATPLWADKELIKQFYVEALRSNLEVDHIIPLRGKSVSGLHVHTNLQLLTKSENSSKGNSYGN
jgi:hypothetical protein